MVTFHKYPIDTPSWYKQSKIHFFSCIYDPCFDCFNIVWLQTSFSVGMCDWYIISIPPIAAPWMNKSFQEIVIIRQSGSQLLKRS